MTQQGLLYYFPSKDELLHAALDIRDQRDVVPRLTPWQGLETSWLLNPSLPVEDVAAAWRDSQLAQMTTGPSLRA